MMQISHIQVVFPNKINYSFNLSTQETCHSRMMILIAVFRVYFSLNLLRQVIVTKRPVEIQV